MVWVAGDIADSTRSKTGLYRWDDWQSFADAMGIRVLYRHLPPWLRGIQLGQTIVLAKGMTRHETARTAWHEIGHIMLHVGNFQHWLSLPWGELVMSKQDAQADDWARLFPIWDEEGLRAWPATEENTLRNRYALANPARRVHRGQR